MAEKTDLYFVLAPNYEGGFRINSVETDEAKARYWLGHQPKGLLFKLQVEKLTKHQDHNPEAELEDKADPGQMLGEAKLLERQD